MRIFLPFLSLNVSHFLDLFYPKYKVIVVVISMYVFYVLTKTYHYTMLCTIKSTDNVLEKQIQLLTTVRYYKKVYLQCLTCACYNF